MKRFKLFFVAALAGCLVFAFTACTPQAQPSTQTTPNTSASQSRSEDTDSSEDSASTDTSLEEYVNSIAEDLEASGSNADADCEVTASGNTVTFAYTSKEQLDDSDGYWSDYLSQYLDDNADTFNEAAEEFAEAVDSSVSLKVVYYNADGTMLAMKMYLGLGL